MSCTQIQTNWDYKSVFLKKNTSNNIIDYMINDHGNKGWELVSNSYVVNNSFNTQIQTFIFRRIRSNN